METHVRAVSPLVWEGFCRKSTFSILKAPNVPLWSEGRWSPPHKDQFYSTLVWLHWFHCNRTKDEVDQVVSVKHNKGKSHKLLSPFRKLACDTVTFVTIWLHTFGVFLDSCCSQEEIHRSSPLCSVLNLFTSAALKLLHLRGIFCGCLLCCNKCFQNLSQQTTDVRPITAWTCCTCLLVANPLCAELQLWNYSGHMHTLLVCSIFVRVHPYCTKHPINKNLLPAHTASKGHLCTGGTQCLRPSGFPQVSQNCVVIWTAWCNHGTCCFQPVDPGWSVCQRIWGISVSCRES